MSTDLSTRAARLTLTGACVNITGILRAGPGIRDRDDPFLCSPQHLPTTGARHRERRQGSNALTGHKSWRGVRRMGAKVRRLVRTSSSALPPSADSHRHNTESPVTSSYAVGRRIRVKTFCGVEIDCIVKSVRHRENRPSYEAVPVGDAKVKEFRAAGVPVDEKNSHEPFAVFEWQILG